MRIGMVLDGNYPSDIRVRKEAESLAKFHDVFILCRVTKNIEPFEVINDVNIIRKIEYIGNFHKGIIDAISAIFFINPFLGNIISDFVKDNKIDVLHVHDLPLAKTVYRTAKKNNIKTVLDLHENYPAALKTWFIWRKNPIIRLKNNIFFNYNRWRKYESSIIKKYDILIAVVEEMKQRLISQHCIFEDKIIVVPNSEKKEFAKNFDTFKNDYFSDYPDKFVISYVGGFGPHRGLHNAIEGMKWVSNVIPNSLLVLVGPSNKDVRTHLENIVEKNNLQKHVLIKGSEPFSRVIDIMKGSDINIIPHISNEHTESAVPHKFFQILLSKKPLLVSDCAPMKRIIDVNGVGTYFKADNPEDFAKKVIDIERDYDKSIKIAEKGFNEAFNGSLNWESTSKDLIKLYNEL